ncbi:hypothetical protein BS47DRAFT_1367112 [Hydnum rufescens UP504]|uniref:Uncharacterized protein n=1 Tax=Hydnum rufescens UP504 TaxID=1448309 RepID=A0A9P6AJC2_9AGAM|nr:hypothetical protein BS47DRAFT_1367112 [Hydnum rufescens UP504]
MPIQQLSLVYRHFDHIDDDPFIGIHSSTPICYSPTPENSFEGIVLSKSIKWTRYIIWVRDHYAPYQRKDLEVVLVVALRIPTGDKIPPRVFPTSVLNLEVIDAVQVSQIYRARHFTLDKALQWMEGWTWWFQEWKSRRNEDEVFTEYGWQK